jgi:dipeptidase D
MSILGHLNPPALWTYFEEICKIPRISKNEEKIREYLLDFAEKNNLEHRADKAGNVFIVRPASPGMENKKTVVLQSHLDMVGEKNASNSHNWLTDSIKPVLNGEWVGADETTLGADDGIGIAAQMAILTDPYLKSGRIECLFTVDEETGMTGAINLEPDFFSGRTLLNLDSEDEGILFIGCAGGMDTVGTMRFDTIPSPTGGKALKIAVTGLHGGHSGDEIHKGYSNSVKVMTTLLNEISAALPVYLSEFDGGNLRNAIPREAFATIITGSKDVDTVKSLIADYMSRCKAETAETEPGMDISFQEVTLPSYSIDSESQKKFLEALTCCPHGVIAWSKDMDDLVETSTNLASARLGKDKTATIVTTQRSSVESSKHEVAGLVEKCLAIAGATVVSSDGYPGWTPDLTSEILSITSASYKRLFGKEPVVKSIHAGLECGMFYEKIADIDMISFGPTIKGAHTPEEKIEISTVEMFWLLLTDVISNMPEKPE